MQQKWQNINISKENKILFCVSKAKMEPKKHKPQEPGTKSRENKWQKPQKPQNKTPPKQNKKCKKLK